MADRIDQLPNIPATPSNVDVNVMKDLFGNIDTMKHVNWKKIIISSIVFVVLNLPITDDLIKSSIINSEIISIGIKTTIFIIILVVLDLI
jgi:hypothetical protein